MVTFPFYFKILYVHIQIPDSVVVSVSAPELFGRVEEGWQAFLLDNPGFGEDNKCVQQVAMAAVAPSAAYVFLTTVDSIGGTVNADFFRDLKSRDKSMTCGFIVPT